MSTLAQLYADVRTKLTAQTYIPLPSDQRTEQLVGRGTQRSQTVITETQDEVVGSNQTRRVETVVAVTILTRATGSTPAETQAAENLAQGALEGITAATWWNTLSSVYTLDGINVADAPNLVGEVVAFTVEAAVSLEVN